MNRCHQHIKELKTSLYIMPIQIQTTLNETRKHIQINKGTSEITVIMPMKTQSTLNWKKKAHKLY